MSQAVMKYYFTKCPKFVELLDVVRDGSDIDSLGAYALQISLVLKLHDSDISLIHHYLKTGQFEPLAAKTPITLIDWGNRQAIPSKYPSEAFNWITNQLIGDREKVHTGLGVSISINDDTTQDELHDFIKNYWPHIKTSLDKNFPNRLKRATTIDRLNDWLEIAERMYLYKKEKDFTKTAFINDLASEFNIGTQEVQRHAKTYRSLMALKYPHYEPDAI